MVVVVIIKTLSSFLCLCKGKKRRQKSQPDPDDASTKWNMDYLVYYPTYICVGWMAISGVPLLSHSIGLML